MQARYGVEKVSHLSFSVNKRMRTIPIGTVTSKILGKLKQKYLYKVQFFENCREAKS